MDNISALLKEAKPLYFARKKRNNRIKTVLSSLVLLFMVGHFYPEKETYNFDYNAYFLEMDVSENDSASVIETMGLPVDEFGLLMVS